MYFESKFLNGSMALVKSSALCVALCMFATVSNWAVFISISAASRKFVLVWSSMVFTPR